MIVTVTRIDSLDRALLRPGRLEEHIELTLPNQKQRKRFFQHFYGDRIDNQKLDNLAEICTNKYVFRNRVVIRIDFFFFYRSYADLKDLYQSLEFDYFKTKQRMSSISRSEFIGNWVAEKSSQN